MNNIGIIFEDNHLLVVEKPPGIPTQGDISGDEDLLSLLKRDIKERYNKPAMSFLGWFTGWTGLWAASWFCENIKSRLQVVRFHKKKRV